jgi:very-short-patch-repair endonuclease
MGEGREGVRSVDNRCQMKRQPSDRARGQAKELRREMTEAEKKIWYRLRSRQTEGYRFRRQVPLGRFIADFVCHEAKLIVEIDGGQHEPLSEQEMHRTRFLEGQGYRILRFWNNEVLQNPDAVQAVIARELRQVTPTQPSPIKGGGLNFIR